MAQPNPVVFFDISLAGKSLHVLCCEFVLRQFRKKSCDMALKPHATVSSLHWRYPVILKENQHTRGFALYLFSDFITFAWNMFQLSRGCRVWTSLLPGIFAPTDRAAVAHIRAHLIRLCRRAAGTGQNGTVRRRYAQNGRKLSSILHGRNEECPWTSARLQRQ